MSEKKEDKLIVIKGARTHNLKNIDVSLPREKLTVITGLSGSGKSSLAFDTLFAEGQRRYVESLSSYARQFLRQMQKPDVDEITGLSPAISIDQKSRSNNPRSTVATITEIYDYLRILFARVGTPYCMVCGREIKKLSPEEIMATIELVVKESGKTIKKDSVMGVSFDKAKVYICAPVVVGRKGEYYQLLYDMLSKGYEKAFIDGVEHSLREKIVLEKNKQHHIDIVVDEFYFSELKQKSKDVSERLNESIEMALHEASGVIKIIAPNTKRLISSKFLCPYDGFAFPEIEPRLFSFNSPHGACGTCNGLGTKYLFSEDLCTDCQGKRLRKEALNVFLHDTDGKKYNIVDIVSLSIEKAYELFGSLKMTDVQKEISSVIVREITERLQFMIDVGIEYLTLDRRAHTLSGGEAQRIRLASQLGSKLVGATYVLDEPTIGLHARDNERLVKTLLELRDIGNTVIVVEHDEDTIFSADYLIDIGPGAGKHGGEVVASGYLKDLLVKKGSGKSSTLEYLKGEKHIEVPNRRNNTSGSLRIRGGNIFNIKNLNVDIPLNRLISVTGVSGSGKSSFVYEILHKNLLGRLERKYRTANLYNCSELTGTEYVGRTIMIDQSPIGRTPRSNPVTYTGAFTFIRDLFAETSEAKARGWKASRFSFNVKGGRCENCQGNGYLAVEMHFLPTVYVPCDVCEGKRFMKDTLEVKYKNKNIHQVLEMTVEDGLEFFNDIPAIADRLRALNDVGLGYLQLGQSATTLSGGEAQRVKVASELYRAHLTRTVYLLDEPTIGLHYDDVKKLIEILQKLVDKGNTVIVIEHNMDVIKSSDYIVDIGPEGGDGGGKLVASGTPEQVAENKNSHTGTYLKKVLHAKKRHSKKENS